MKNVKKQPVFKNEDQERDFWATADVTDYVDLKDAIVNPDFSNLKYSTETISLRLPQSLLRTIKMEANELDIPYQSYMKVLLAQALEKGNAYYSSKTTHSMLRDAPARRKKR